MVELHIRRRHSSPTGIMCIHMLQGVAFLLSYKETIIVSKPQMNSSFLHVPVSGTLLEFGHAQPPVDKVLQSLDLVIVTDMFLKR